MNAIFKIVDYTAITVKTVATISTELLFVGASHVIHAGIEVAFRLHKLTN